MTITDYDALRPSAAEILDVETLDDLGAGASGSTARSAAIDLDDTETAESVELPGADLSGEELFMPIIPRQRDEFLCASCFLLQHRSRLAHTKDSDPICIDCL